MEQKSQKKAEQVSSKMKLGNPYYKLYILGKESMQQMHYLAIDKQGICKIPTGIRYLPYPQIIHYQLPGRKLVYTPFVMVKVRSLSVFFIDKIYYILGAVLKVCDHFKISL